MLLLASIILKINRQNCTAAANVVFSHILIQRNRSKIEMATYNTIPELIDSYEDRFRPNKAEGVDGVVQLNISGENAGKYHLIIRDQELDIREGEHENPTVTVVTDADTWLDINNGKANPVMMMMQGKMKIKGSMPMATKFQSMFR